MSRPTTKTDLLEASETKYEQLQELIASLTDEELATPFDFSGDSGKKEAHWQRDKNLRDVLIHLYEWHQLILQWVEANQHGESKPFLPEPYNWKTYGDMNVALWQKHQATSLEQAKKLFAESHKEVLHLAESLNNKELFTKDAFPWVGGSTLGQYFVSTMSSHYDWAMKKLKAHRQRLAN